ncbi:unnamed protein product, partial [Linum tenue]
DNDQAPLSPSQPPRRLENSPIRAGQPRGQPTSSSRVRPPPPGLPRSHHQGNSPLEPSRPVSLPHQSMEDCTFSGRSVRKGTWLIVNISKIQHDPRVWSDPDEFRPDWFLTTHSRDNSIREQFSQQPVGSGRRMCPGVNFALRVMHLTLATLLHGFDFVRPGSKPVDMTEGIGLTVPRATPLDVLLSPRLPPHLYG